MMIDLYYRAYKIVEYNCLDPEYSGFSITTPTGKIVMSTGIFQADDDGQKDVCYQNVKRDIDVILSAQTDAPYDSAKDTLEHIAQVRRRLDMFIKCLHMRGRGHDESKFSEEEKPLFDKLTPILKDLTYGSDEYKASLAELKPALDHHYVNNSHHPEHYSNGIDGMDLIDIVEMFCDWKAATERHTDGNFSVSLDINRVRFNMGDQLHNIFSNTLKNLGW